MRWNFFGKMHFLSEVNCLSETDFLETWPCFSESDFFSEIYFFE